MAKARAGRLTERDRQQLTQARQLLRRARRPAMNPQPPGNYREYHAAKHTTPGARKQIAGLMKQGWEFDRTVIYPSGTINFHLLSEGRTAILNEDGTIHMLYPVGTKVHDALKSRDVTQGYGAEPNPARFPHARHLVELKKIKISGAGMAFAIVRDGEEIGFITKYRDTRTETHPWKAFVGIGEHSTFLGVAYGSDGKARAIQAVVDGIPLENRGRVAKSKVNNRGRSSAIRQNPGGKLQRIGRALEVRYRRDVGRVPGYYKHKIESHNAGVYTIPPGWVYVSTKSVLITEREPRTA